MDVQLGHSDRYGGPVHLIVDVGGRKVLACAGGASKNLSAVPFEQAGEGLDCDLCRRFVPTFLGAVFGSLAWHKSGRISPAMFCVASLSHTIPTDDFAVFPINGRRPVCSDPHKRTAPSLASTHGTGG
jgi:hypothetical protein